MINLAKDPSTAGLILALCIEDIGDSELEEQVLLEDEDDAIRLIHEVAARGCKVAPAASEEVLERAESLVRNATGQEVVVLFSLALATLRQHWLGNETEARALVRALMKLVYADGEVTDHEGTMVGMLLHVMEWSPDLIV